MSDSVFILVLLPISLFIILFSLGLALTVADFRRVAVYPRGVAIGMANLIFISPLLAVGLAIAFKLPPELAVGMVLLGASPGGTTANMLTHLAKGDTALSLTMTAISSVAAVFTVPILLDLSTQWFMHGEAQYEIAMMPIVMKILLITLLPLGIGMIVRSRATQWSIRFEPLVKKIATIFFILVVFVVLWSEQEHICSNIARVGSASTYSPWALAMAAQNSPA
jgi:BASS family bile acid:Na+ symporter